MPPNGEIAKNNSLMRAPEVVKSYGSVSFGDKSDTAHDNELQSLRAKKTTKIRLTKTDLSFYEDARAFTHGTVPHSIAVALVVGVVCGIAAYLYYAILFWVLDFLWHQVPEKLVIDQWPESLYWTWIPIVGFVMAIGVGVTVKFMGGKCVCSAWLSYPWRESPRHHSEPSKICRFFCLCRTWRPALHH